MSNLGKIEITKVDDDGSIHLKVTPNNPTPMHLRRNWSAPFQKLVNPYTKHVPGVCYPSPQNCQPGYKLVSCPMSSNSTYKQCGSDSKTCSDPMGLGYCNVNFQPCSGNGYSCVYDQ